MARLVFGASVLVVAVLASWLDLRDEGNRIQRDGAEIAAPARSVGAPEASRPRDAAQLRRQEIVHVAEPAVVGFVTDAGGRAVAGAVVHADLRTSDDRVLLALGRVATDFDGRYSVAMAALHGWSAPACSGLHVIVEAEVTATGATADDLQALRCDEHGVLGMRLDLQLAPDPGQRIVRGRVVDAAGRGVPAAKVWWWDEGRRDAVAVRPDATFRVALDDRPVMLDAHDPRAGWTRIEVGRDAAEDLVLVLRPCGASLRGTVRFADGTPARGLRVGLVQRLDRNGQPGIGCDGCASDVEVHIDDAGDLVACGLAEGWWSVHLPDDAGAAQVGGGTPTSADAEAMLVRTGQPFAIELSAARVVLDVVEESGRDIHGGELGALIWAEPDDATRAATILAGAGNIDADFENAADGEEARLCSSLEAWTKPGAVVSWRAQAPGTSMAFGWFQLPARAGEMRRRIVLSPGVPQGGVQLDLRDATGAPVRADRVRVWRAGCEGALRLPWLQPASSEDDRLRVGSDNRVPLPEGYWQLEVFADHACLHPCTVDAFVPPAGVWVPVGAVSPTGARIAVRLVWSTAQVGPDENVASGVCGSALRRFGVRWLAEDDADHDLDLRDESGNGIDVWSPRAAQLDAVATAVLPVSAGRMMVKAGLYEPVEIAEVLQAGWNHFVLRLDRRGRPFAIERRGR